MPAAKQTARVSMPVSHARALLAVWRGGRGADAAVTVRDVERAARAVHRVELAVRSCDRAAERAARLTPPLTPRPERAR